MPRWSPSVVLALAACLATAACSRPSEESGAKKWPAEPPPSDNPPPAELAIEVQVDGGAHAPITAALLAGTKADFRARDRQAWLIPTLVAEASAPGVVVEAVSSAGVSVKFERPGAGGIEPVLFLTRRGEVMVSAIDPKDPFPDYHGQGGRLHRSGDSWPRVQPVARLVITRPTP